MARSTKIRTAKPEDAGLLTELAFTSKAHWNDSPEFLARCRAVLAVSAADVSNPNYRYVLAEEKEEILGYYALQKMSPTELEIDAMFVRPSAIGKGIGRQLVEHALELAFRMNAEYILVQSDPNAAAFYKRMGAEPTGTRISQITNRLLPLLRFDVAG